MIGCVAFSHNAVHASETVDYKMVSALGADIVQEGFTDPSQGPVVLGREGSLRAFGSMKHDAGGIGTANGGRVRRACREFQVAARMVRNGVAVVNPKAVAIRLRVRRIFDLPDFGRLPRSEEHTSELQSLRHLV